MILLEGQSITVRLPFLKLVLSTPEPMPLNVLLKYPPPAHFPPDVDISLEVRHLAPILRGIVSGGPVAPIHTSLAEYLGDDTRSGPFHIQAQHISRLRVILNAFRSISTGRAVPGLQHLNPDDVEMCVGHVLRLLQSQAADEQAHLEWAREGHPELAWIGTACRFVMRESKSTNNREQLEELHTILRATKYEDALYTAALEECCYSAPFERIMLLLRMFLFPLNWENPLVHVSRFLDFAADHLPSETETRALLGACWPFGRVLLGYDDKFECFFGCPQTFTTFITDRLRSGRFFIDPPSGHALWAEFCISMMNRHLKFNIAGIQTSFIRNRSLPREEIRRRIGPVLSYSCEYWLRHASIAVRGGHSLPSLADFLENRTLQWLEVMVVFGVDLSSVLSRLDVLAVCIFGDSQMLGWCSCFIQTASPSPLISSVIQFIETFSVPMNTSAPHIYVSALAFVPQCSLFPPPRVFHPGIARIMEDPLVQRPRCLHADFKGRVVESEAIAISRDGTLIASSLHGHTIRLENAWTGQGIAEPLSGHNDWVSCIAFSHDGERLVSGSNDEAIRLWDVQTKAEIGVIWMPEGSVHMGIQCIAIAADDTQVVAASHAQITVWDVESCTSAGEPLIGHSAEVLCLAYSPNGDLIASGSADESVRLWDARTHTTIIGPLFGHHSPVHTIVFAPDGVIFASGSEDGTICLWDTKAGATLGAPLKGHSAPVVSIAFSPDGAQMVSGSFEDDCVCLWDVRKRDMIGKTLVLESFGVQLVTFSRDGARFASVSDDAAVRLWDARTGAPTAVPLAGESCIVAPFAATPNNLDILPGLIDQRAWLSASGTVASGSRGQRIEIGSERDLSLEHVLEKHRPMRTSSGAFLLDENGWITGAYDYDRKGDNLLLWVPPRYRRRVINASSRRTSVLDPGVILDARHFKIGYEWTECQDPSLV